MGRNHSSCPFVCSVRVSINQLTEQRLNASFDVVADGTDRVDALASRVHEFPVLIARAGEDRAGVAAAHRDDDIGRFHGIGSEQLGLFGLTPLFWTHIAPYGEDRLNMQHSLSLMAG